MNVSLEDITLTMYKHVNNQVNLSLSLFLLFDYSCQIQQVYHVTSYNKELTIHFPISF